jgi:hypothetical protein
MRFQKQIQQQKLRRLNEVEQKLPSSKKDDALGQGAVLLQPAW